MVGEVVWEQHPAVPHVVEDVAEHLAVSVNEVVLFERVQDDRDGPVEKPRQSALRVPVLGRR